MAAVNDILNNLKELAPVNLKMDFDNVGLLTGFGSNEVKKILVALDITDEVIEEAVNADAQLIVSHHPLFFGLKNIVDSDNTGKKIIRLIQNGISAICMHTNLDAAVGGVNTCLAKTVGIAEPLPMYDTEAGIGCYGELAAPMEFNEYLSFVKSALNSKGLRYVSGNKTVKRVAVVGGSGGGDLERAIELGCDTFITADLKYHQFLLAKESGVNLIDGDHFCTENVVVPALAQRLSKCFPEIEVLISEKHSQTVCFF